MKNTVILIFKDLNETNACGCDGIPFKYLRDALPVLAFYITIIVNTSIVTGFYPKLWKHPYVAPYFESGDIDNIGNYRPISLLPIISKILEKIVAIQLISFMETNELLAQSQHGFRPNLSTETALMKVNEFLYNNIDNQRISLMLLLDLSKAFDSVCHDFLLRKCKKKMKIDRFWFGLNRINDRLDCDTRLIAVQSLALSIINYCLKVWGMTTKEQLDRVQKVQNFAARVAMVV